MAWLYFTILILIALCGVALVIMTLPGLWLMFAATVIYALLTKGAFISWGTLLLLFVLAAVAEIMEIMSSGKGAKRAGAKRPGIWGALIGSIVGGIAGSFIPIIIIGTLIGVILGTFVGAMAGEMLFGRTAGRSAVIGLSAAGGRLFGTIIKIGFGCVMLGIILGMGLPVHFHKVSTPASLSPAPPATAPTTNHAK